MRKMKQLLAAGLMMSMIAATSAGTSVFASTPEVVETNESTKTESSKETAQKVMDQYQKIEGIDSEKTILGADFSHYQQNVGWNKVWKDYKGNAVNNLFSYVKTQGINTISVKIAVNPGKDNKYLSLENAEKTLKEAKKAGLRTNAVLLYSDEMTYANTQNLPDGWTADDAGEKAIAYTQATLKALDDDDALPDIVTVGNEVNYNFLGISGNDGFVQMGKITQEIKKDYKDIKTAVSISMPNDPSYIKWVQNQLNGDWNNISYDYLGVNVYPDENTNTNIEKLRKEFENNQADAGVNKDAQLIVSNVKYPRNDDEAKTSVYTQTKNIYDLLTATIDDKNKGGIIYDEGEVVDGWNSFFDNGQAAMSLSIFAYAQGKGDDTNVSVDPWIYGGESGLKDQKVTIKKVTGMSENAMRGMDISSYEALKNAGVKYYDNDGNEESLLKVLHDNGVNYIRIRIWNDPFNKDGETYGGGGNDVKTGLKIAKEATKYDMKILLDFHYSDFWTDPSVQLLPKAWKADENDETKMCDNIYQFTKETIQKFKEAGADVGMAQVGNELTNGGFGIYLNRDAGKTYDAVWGDKKKSTKINTYLKAGIKAVRETLPESLVALHLETPNVKKYQDIMNTWKRDKVDYDVLGSSYYPFWSTWAKANTPETLSKVQDLAASYGKLFAVLETGWANSLKDADGTGNTIGESANTSAYSVSPQGQVDELTDLYKTVMSKGNGLGAFYWEGAWIPVRAGQTYWKYNKEQADKYGTGWASAGAKDYFVAQKLYYNGQPAWGGCSWDNITLFDFNGHPLQSLRFYKDSVSKGAEQIAAINICDKNGKQIAATQYAKVEIGKTKTVTLPKVAGYAPETNSYKMTVKGTKDGIVQQKVVYKKLPQGAAINYNYRVKVTSKKYKVYSNFNWKKTKTNLYKKTYVAKYKYSHQNGSTYLALYTKAGKFVGYINQKAVKRLGYATQPEQGKAYKYGKRVKITKKNYKLYKNFQWKKSKTKVYKKTYTAKYRYKHENGYKYLALYTKSGKFVGYINSKAVRIVK
ncbi:glycosyl hydrolase 53 family protein [Anaerostipes hadrus]|nr:glycosyl hydrolase 53 family protein [Anaerostipes hadrus]